MAGVLRLKSCIYARCRNVTNAGRRAGRSWYTPICPNFAPFLERDEGNDSPADSWTHPASPLHNDDIESNHPGDIAYGLLLTNDRGSAGSVRSCRARVKRRG